MSERLVTERELEGVLRRLTELEQRLGRVEVTEVPIVQVGTWEPKLSGDGVQPGVFTYNATVTIGYYTRDGNRVDFDARVLITAITTPPTAGSNIRISLPTIYTVATSPTPFAGVAYIDAQTGVTYTAGYGRISGYVLSASPFLYLRQTGSGVAAANILAGNIGLVGGNIDFVIAGSYRVA